MPHVSRNAVIGGTVVLLHVAVLWAMNAGLVRRVVETVVPVQIVSELITPPVPKIAPAPPAPPVAAPAPAPAPRPVAKPQPRPPAPAPRPIAAPLPAPPSPTAPTAAAEPQPAPPPASAPVAAAPAPAAPLAAAPTAPPAPARLDLPSSDADYLQNPQPPYPPISRRMGEQGQVMLRVLIGADGLPREVELRRSSGYDRLDRAAVDTVRKWRFVPGKRNGVPETMWFNVPINFVLE